MSKKLSKKPSRHVVAFHVKPGPLNTLETIKRLRQLRHGLENAPDPTSQFLREARDNVDKAITALTQHVFIHENHSEETFHAHSNDNLETMT